MTGSSIPTRTPAMILADALVKHRVLKGIALLEEKHGPDWADKIDLDTLDLGSASFCVLGQLYRDPDVVTDDVVETYRRSSRALRWVGKRIDEEFPSLRSTRETLKYGVSGYERGIAVLDGPLLDDDVWGLSRHGFESDVIYFDGLVAMSDEKLADLGVTRQMVNDALSDTRRYVRADYEALTEEWTGAINARKGAA